MLNARDGAERRLRASNPKMQFLKDNILAFLTIFKIDALLTKFHGVNCKLTKLLDEAVLNSLYK